MPYQKKEWKPKLYVAIYNNEASIFKTWKECHFFIETHSGCKYKSFEDKDAAQEYINNNISTGLSFDLPGVLYCYVDGSFSDPPIGASAAFVAVKDGKAVYEKSSVCGKDKTAIRQVWGELFATLSAIEYAILKKEPRVIIVYDYQGIEMWANGSWKCNKPETRDYVEKINKYKQVINIDFIHVKAHSKEKNAENIFNDRADKLAKEAGSSER